MRIHMIAAIVLASLTGVGAVEAQGSSYVTQVSRGQVSLRVEPAWVDTALVIEVSANTHSGELRTVDLRTQSRLRVGTATLEPVVVGTLSGHHARATLVFRMPRRPAGFTLEIRDVPDVPVRTLTWPPDSPIP